MGSFRLDGQIAMVTGGGTGLGLAIAKALANAGAKTALVGRRPKTLADACDQIGPSASSWQADVTDLATLPDLVSRIETQLGPLDILVNNAGVHLKKPALETSDDEFFNVIQTHLLASFTLTREVVKRMLPLGRGSVLFIGSMASLFGIPEVAAYTAAKAAVVGLTKALAVEWSSQGVRVNAIAPGWIDSGMARIALAKDPARQDKIVSRTPMQRLGDDIDIGAAAVYLCSPAAQFVTGTTHVVDGGVSIGF